MHLVIENHGMFLNGTEDTLQDFSWNPQFLTWKVNLLENSTSTDSMRDLVIAKWYLGVFMSLVTLYCGVISSIFLAVAHESESCYCVIDY